MNVLIEFLSASGRFGAGEYHRRVVTCLLDYIRRKDRDDINLYVLYDHCVPISFEDMREDSIGQNNDVKFLDVHGRKITEIIKEYNIHRFFIACGQRMGVYSDIINVDCEVICVTHDMLYEEWYDNHLYEYWDACKNKRQSLSMLIKSLFGIVKHEIKSIVKYILGFDYCGRGGKELEYMSNIVRMLNLNPRSQCIMVSEYSKISMAYNYGLNPNKIKVLYSPERIAAPLLPIENNLLSEVIKNGRKYYLLLSADRDSKNAQKAINAFKKFVNYDKDAYLLVTGLSVGGTDKIIMLGFLSDSDLMRAMQNCYALVYPSYFEGFGYPPLEAMKFGKPVLCSYATSIPEILGDAPLYFCPLYESAIFQALTLLTNDNYVEYSKRSTERYNYIHRRQEEDLGTLVDLILSPVRDGLNKYIVK